MAVQRVLDINSVFYEVCVSISNIRVFGGIKTKPLISGTYAEKFYHTAYPQRCLSLFLLMLRSVTGVTLV